MEPDQLEGNLGPLFETIIAHIPAPEADEASPLQMQVTMLDYNDFLGRIGIGRIYRGTINVNDMVAVVKRDGSIKRMRVQKLFGFSGLQRNADGLAEFWVQGVKEKISVLYGPKYPIAVIYAPPGRNFICFEPMAAPTNAFNLAHEGKYKDLQTVAPGSKWSESFWVKPSGF